MVSSNCQHDYQFSSSTHKLCSNQFHLQQQQQQHSNETDCHQQSHSIYHCSHQYRSHSHHRSNICYQWILFSILFILSSSLLTFTVTSAASYSSSSYRDKDEISETICKPVPEEKISISCPEDMKLVIKESYFSTNLDSNAHCGENNYIRRATANRDCYEDLRPSIIAKCMTYKNCSFNYSELTPQCSGPGHLLMKYSCIKPYLLAHYCNSIMDRPYGYISSPTYPDYSAAVEECNWTITANEGQTIELQVLDLQITNPRTVKPKTFLEPAVYECTDSLTIDADQKVDDLCGDEIGNLKTFKTKGSTIRLSYKQNEFRGATRGWLVRYQVNGCPKLKDPFKGHIVEQNETYALISCCEGYLFRDTRESKKYLNCLRNNWDGTVSSCISKSADPNAPDMSPEANSIDGEIDNNISTNLPLGHQLSKPIDETSKALFSDFVVPISLMVLLVVVLVIFVVTIVKCRSRRSKANLLSYTPDASVPLTNTSPVNV